MFLSVGKFINALSFIGHNLSIFSQKFSEVALIILSIFCRPHKSKEVAVIFRIVVSVINCLLRVKQG